MSNYKTPEGFIHGDENPEGESQNGVLFTAEYVLNVHNNSINQNQAAFDLIVNALNKVRTNATGVTVRKPGDREYQSQDNIIAHLYLESVLNQAGTSMSQEAPYLAIELKSLEDSYYRFKRINGPDTGYWEADKVKQNRYAYYLAMLLGTEQLCVNPFDPTKFCLFSWYGRNPATLALIDLVAEGKTTLFRKLALAASLQIFSGKHEETNSKKLAFLCWHILVNTGEIRSLIFRNCFKLWVKRLNKLYPLGMKQIYEIYYPDHNHPTALNSRIDFELLPHRRTNFQ